MKEDITTFEIIIRYNAKDYALKVETIYESTQLMRMKVHGRKSSITLQNNFPMVKSGKKAIQWKLIGGDPPDAELLTQIMYKLEKWLKNKA